MQFSGHHLTNTGVIVMLIFLWLMHVVFCSKSIRMEEENTFHPLATEEAAIYTFKIMVEGSLLNSTSRLKSVCALLGTFTDDYLSASFQEMQVEILNIFSASYPPVLAEAIKEYRSGHLRDIFEGRVLKLLFSAFFDATDEELDFIDWNFDAESMFSSFKRLASNFDAKTRAELLSFSLLDIGDNKNYSPAIVQACRKISNSVYEWVNEVDLWPSVSKYLRSKIGQYYLKFEKLMPEIFQKALETMKKVVPDFSFDGHKVDLCLSGYDVLEEVQASFGDKVPQEEMRKVTLTAHGFVLNHDCSRIFLNIPVLFLNDLEIRNINDLIGVRILLHEMFHTFVGFYVKMRQLSRPSMFINEGLAEYLLQVSGSVDILTQSALFEGTNPKDTTNFYYRESREFLDALVLKFGLTKAFEAVLVDPPKFEHYTDIFLYLKEKTLLAENKLIQG